MKVKNIRHLMLGIICLVLAVICLAVGAAGGSAPKYLISAVLLLALGAVNFHGALKGGAEQELLRWTDERDRLVAMRSCQITLQVMNGLLFGGAMTALLCYAITRRALFQTVGITLCAVILTLFFVTMAANATLSGGCKMGKVPVHFLHRDFSACRKSLTEFAPARGRLRYSRKGGFLIQGGELDGHGRNRGIWDRESGCGRCCPAGRRGRSRGRRGPGGTGSSWRPLQ